MCTKCCSVIGQTGWLFGKKANPYFVLILSDTECQSTDNWEYNFLRIQVFTYAGQKIIDKFTCRMQVFLIFWQLKVLHKTSHNSPWGFAYLCSFEIFSSSLVKGEKKNWGQYLCSPTEGCRVPGVPERKNGSLLRNLPKLTTLYSDKKSFTSWERSWEFVLLFHFWELNVNLSWLPLSTALQCTHFTTSEVRL